MIIVLEEIGGSVCQNDIQVNVETLLTPGRAWLAKHPPSIRFTNEHLKKKKRCDSTSFYCFTAQFCAQPAHILCTRTSN